MRVLISTVLIIIGMIGFSIAKETYFCPMHPTYTSDRPGSCPICGMDLVKKEEQHKSSSTASSVEGYVPVVIDPQMQKTIGVVTETVHMKPLTKTIRAPGVLQRNSTAYVSANVEIFEDDINLIKFGQKAYVYIPALKQEFEGKVLSIGREVNEQTRTVKIRVDIYKLKSYITNNIYANVQIPIQLNESIVVPVNALMRTGQRSIVFVDMSKGRYEPVEVKTGQEADGYIEIIEGLKDGDQIVTKANFLIDSESRLKAAIGG